MKLPVSFLRAYFYCSVLPYMLAQGIVRGSDLSARGTRLHKAYLELSVKASKLVEAGLDPTDAVNSTLSDIINLLKELNSPNPVSEARILADFRTRVGFAGFPVKCEVELESDLLIGRVDLIEGYTPIEVKTGRISRGDIFQVVAYTLLMDIEPEKVAIDYIPRGRVWINVTRELVDLVKKTIPKVAETIVEPKIPERKKMCRTCSYRAECSLLFPR